MRIVINLITMICVIFAVNTDLFAQDREGIEMVGDLYNFWDTSSDILIDGDIAYIADGRAGLKVINIADPENIAEIAGVSLCDNARKLRRDGDILYVLDYRHGLHLVDVSDVENPRSVNYYPIGAYDFDISGDYLYFAARDLLVVNKADPENLEEVGTCEVDWTLTAVNVRADFVYGVRTNFGEGGTRGCLINIADPENPEMVDDQFGHYSRTEFRDNNGFSASRGLYIHDFENPADPELIGSIQDDSMNQGIFLAGNTVFSAGESFCTFSVENLNAPQLISEIDMPGMGYKLAVQNNNAFVMDSEFFFYGSECRDDVIIINCENVEDPQVIGTYGSTGMIHDVEVSVGIAYLACMQNGLKIIDVTNPEQPEELATIETEDKAFGVEIAGDLLFVAEYEAGLRIYNIEDPNNIAELGSLDTPGRAKDVAVVGEFAYLVDGADGFRVIDISDPANPAETGSLRMQADAWCVTVEDNVAYVGGYHQNLYLIDVSDPENPQEISSVWGAGHPLGIAIQDGFAYTSNWCNENGSNVSGLSIINVQDPENPEYLGVTRTEGQSHDIVVSGDFAYITDGERGLKVFDISDHENIEQIAFYNTPGMACRMTIDEGLIYLADQTNLGIYIPLFDNQAPEVIAEIEDLVIDEDPEPRHVVIADLDDIINDPDGNAGLVFSVQDAPDEVNMEIENDHILSVSPEDNFNLPDGYRVIITAEDIGGLAVDTDFMLTINPVNDVPENFQLLEPADESECSYDYPVCFRWSESFDPDEGEDVSYVLSLDCEFLGISLSYQIPEDSTSMTISLDTLNGGCVTVRTLWWVTGISGDDSTECDQRSTLLVAGPGNVEQNDQPAFDFGLTTAFPNPFNSTTTIGYSLPHLSDVSLHVYNLAGKKVSTLFEGKRQTGVYNTNMTAYNLPTGIYILKMEASGQVFTQKVMLIK